MLCVLRQRKSVLSLAPAVVSLMLFAYLLTLAPSDHAGRAYAAYGGIYIVASLLWLWRAEGRGPDTGTLLTAHWPFCRHDHSVRATHVIASANANGR